MMAGKGSSHHPAVPGARPVVLVRYRPGLAGEASRTVHLMPAPFSGHDGAATTLCGTLLRPHEVEIVAPGQGMPCELCLVSRTVDGSPSRAVAHVHPDAGLPAATTLYHELDWPVTVRRGQAWLRLAPATVALIIPDRLAAEVTEILAVRRCLPPVLTQPNAPGHRVMLAGEPYPVPLPWPPGVNRTTTTLLLPPTLTRRGPLHWVHPPHDDSFKLCREIDILAAVRTAL